MYGDLTDTLGKVTQYFNLGDVKIDNLMFRSHYIVSVVIFVGYSLIVTMNTYAGDPIDCLHNKQGEDWGDDYLDWFCFIHGTESLKYPREGEAHATIGFFDCLNEDGTEKEGTDCKTEHPHYMWVALVVLIQAGISYLPRYLWFSWEGGRMKQMLSNLMEKPKFFNENKEGECRTASFAQSKGESEHELHLCSSGNSLTEELAKSYIDSIGDNSYYSFKFSIAEWLCLLVCFVQISLTDAFLNSSFLSYGSDIINDISIDPFTRTDPMERTLPIVTLCTLPKYGTAGHKETTTAICVLPNNVVHQKFYLFLWFWLLFITIVTVLHQIYRLALYFMPAFRSYMTTEIWTVNEHDNDVDKLIKNMVDHTDYSDWVVLSFFHNNLTTVNFQNFMEDLAFTYEEKKKN